MRNDLLKTFVEDVNISFKEYRKLDKKALSRDETFDGPVYVEFGTEAFREAPLSPLDLRNICQSACRGSRLDYFGATNRLVVRECASALMQGEAVQQVNKSIGLTVNNLSDGTDGMYIHFGSKSHHEIGEGSEWGICG